MNSKFINKILLPIYDDPTFKTPDMKGLEWVMERFYTCLPDIAGKKILEIGSNSGFDSFLASKNGAAKVVSLETNEYLLNISNDIKNRNKFDNVEFINKSWPEYVKETEETFDIIVSFAVLTIDDLRNFLPIILKKCKKFIWAFDNGILLDDGNLVEAWNESDIRDILSIYNHKILRKRKDEEFGTHTLLDYWTKYKYSNNTIEYNIAKNFNNFVLLDYWIEFRK